MSESCFYLTRREHWIINKFPQRGKNLVCILEKENDVREIYVNNKLIAIFEKDLSIFPFALPSEWIHELHEIEADEVYE